MNAKLLESEFPLEELPLVIGRGTECGIRVVDRWASRSHCEITGRDGSLVVQDLGSTHGTLLNGQPVTESPLTAGDRLTVGMTTFVVAANGRDWDSNGASSMLVLRGGVADVATDISRRKPR